MDLKDGAKAKVLEQEIKKNHRRQHLQLKREGCTIDQEEVIHKNSG